MQKCVLISSDNRLAVQLRAWFREFTQEPYLESFPSIESFEAKYGEPIKRAAITIDDKDKVDGEKSERSRAEELEREAETSPMRLFLCDLDAIQSRPLDWIVEKRKLLVELGHAIEQTPNNPVPPTRIMVLGYEDPHLRPDRFRHDLIDDMVIKPLDQQLFMQKVELLLAEKADIAPSFLFRAQTKMPVEIGKDAVIDEISDFAISVRNPTSLSTGIFAQIHADVFGEGYTGGRVLGRVYASVRHPQFENQWLIRFSLFGISNLQLGELRRFLRARAIPGRARPPAAKAKKEKLPPKYRVAVIDLDRDELSLLQTTVEENFDRTAAVAFPSYTRFLAGLIKLSESQIATIGTHDEPIADDSPLEPEHIEEAFPFDFIRMIVDAPELTVKRFEPPLLGGIPFLGWTQAEWMSKGKGWLDIVPKADADDCSEFLTYTQGGGQAITGIRLIHKNGLILYAELKGRLQTVTSNESAGSTEKRSELVLEFRPIDKTTWMELNRMAHRGQTAEAYRFDAIIIDGSLIRTDCDTWLGSLHQAMVKARVIEHGEPLPRILVLGEEDSRVSPALFAHRGISDFIFKPLDRKLLTDKLATCVPELSRSMPLDGPQFMPCELPAQLCKTAEMEELSEFGLTINHPTPFRPRTFMRFFSPLFGEQSGGVIGRCVISKAITGDTPKFSCQFIFFGASAELHQRIRNWIREDYVNRKDVG
ncbi:MAG: hypothetical protein IPJ84_12820 [Bdellovibrionales bacterium]|nr:hypothetical protein [Bdellovibrionales bacterium]